MNDAKEEIRDRLNIEDVIGEYVELKRAGRNFKALSPFSNEKTPSFIVSPDKRIWHDFSSGRGGDIFSFIMEIEGVEFREALKILARKAGVELQLFNSANAQKIAKRKAREAEIYTLVTRYYQAILLKNPHALDYAKNQRRLTDQTIKDFAIGYAPNHKRALIDFLLKRGYRLSELVDAGLTNQYKTDLFRARLMIPLSDAMGQTIGFTGRGLDKESVPKYLNTPSTLLYDKSRHVFGLFQAKESIRKLNQAVIVEGNMDVISSHQAGVKNVVATAGTAMTEQHLKILARYTSDIRLAFDSDQAGINATERAIVLAQTANVDLKIITLKGNNAKDPDELIQQDVQLWIDSIAEARPALDWLMTVYQQKFDLSQSTQKRDYSRKILTTLVQLNDPVEKESYLQKLADILGISLEAIREQMEDLTKPTEAKPRKSIKNRRLEVDESRYQDELLALGLISSEVRQQLTKLKPEYLLETTDKPRRQLHQLLTAHVMDFNKEMLSNLQDLTIYAKVLTLKTEERYSLWSKTEVEQEARRLINKAEKDFQINATNDLTAQLQQAEYDGDEQLATEIRAKLNQLIKGDKK